MPDIEPCDQLVAKDHAFAASKRAHSAIRLLRKKIAGSANHFPQHSNGLGGGQAHSEPVLVSTTDDCSVIGIFPDPDHPFGVDENFHAIHIFKHDELHGVLLITPAFRFQEMSRRARGRLYRML
jgi:hypothetical protein